MTITIEYETEETLSLPYEDIIDQVVEESLDYVECPYDEIGRASCRERVF